MCNFFKQVTSRGVIVFCEGVGRNKLLIVQIMLVYLSNFRG